MSFKAVLIVVGLASAATAVAKSRPEAAPEDVTTQVSADATESGELGVGAKIQRGFGSVGVMLVGKLVTSSVAKTDRVLAEMGPALKKKKGPDGKRAREAAKKAMVFDSIAMASLEEKHPVVAVNMAMKGRDFMAVARTNLMMP